MNHCFLFNHKYTSKTWKRK